MPCQMLAVYALKANTYTEALSYLIRAYDLCESMSEKDPHPSVQSQREYRGDLFNNSRTDTLVREQKLGQCFVLLSRFFLKNVENTVDDLIH